MKNLIRILFLIILFSNNLKCSTVAITALTPPGRPCTMGLSCTTDAMCINCQNFTTGLGLFPLAVTGRASGVKTVSVTLHNNFDGSDQPRTADVLSNGTWTVSFPIDGRAIPTSAQIDGSTLIITAEATGAISSKAFLIVKPNKAACGPCGPGVLCVIPQDILTLAILKKYIH